MDLLDRCIVDCLRIPLALYHGCRPSLPGDDVRPLVAGAATPPDFPASRAKLIGAVAFVFRGTHALVERWRTSAFAFRNARIHPSNRHEAQGVEIRHPNSVAWAAVRFSNKRGGAASLPPYQVLGQLHREGGRYKFVEEVLNFLLPLLTSFDTICVGVDLPTFLGQKGGAVLLDDSVNDCQYGRCVPKQSSGELPNPYDDEQGDDESGEDGDRT